MPNPEKTAFSIRLHCIDRTGLLARVTSGIHGLREGNIVNATEFSFDDAAFFFIIAEWPNDSLGKNDAQGYTSEIERAIREQFSTPLQANLEVREYTSRAAKSSVRVSFGVLFEDIAGISKKIFSLFESENILVVFCRLQEVSSSMKRYTIEVEWNKDMNQVSEFSTRLQEIPRVQLVEAEIKFGRWLY